MSTLHYDTSHNQLSPTLTWIRTICAYVTVVNGTLFCALAFFVLF